MRINNLFFYFFAGIFIVLLFVVSKNLDAPYLWFDEAGQFFISKGLNHDSDPLEKANGLSHVIENNAFYNLDPGGFSIILHFWSKISDSHVWLRILPFLFFSGLLAAFIYLSYSWHNSREIALLTGFIPLFIPVFLKMGFEVRAYSMECLGTILCVIGLGKLKNNISYRNLFLWSCIFAVFITSRYAEIIVVFMASVYVIYVILRSSQCIKQKSLSILLFSSPLIITLIFIYFSALMFQNKDLKELVYLPYLSRNIFILAAPENFLFVCAIGTLMAFYSLKNRFPDIKKYETLLFLTITVNISFILLSVWGKHPWAPYSNRCISLLLLVLLCGAALLGETAKNLFPGKSNIKYSLLVILLLLCLNHRKNSFQPRLQQGEFFANIDLVNFGDYHRIYVDRWESPCIRYLFEYGKLKTAYKGLYPGNFTFGKLFRHGFYVFSDGVKEGKMSIEDFYKAQPKMNDYVDYDLLIAPELFMQGHHDKWTLLNNSRIFFTQKNKAASKSIHQE